MNKPKEIKPQYQEKNKHNLLNEIVKKEKDKLKFISLEIGSSFLKKEELPKGILIIKKGILSIKLTDQNDNKKFTIENLKKGDLAGVDQIIGQSNYSDIIASTKVEGYFLEKKFFLELINKNFQTIESYIKFSKYELYCSISFFLFGKIQKSYEIFNILNSSSFDLKIETLTPGIKNLNSNSETYILSSSNIEGLNIGDTITGPKSLNVLGDLPARLIKSEELSNLKNIDEPKISINNNKNSTGNIIENFDLQKEGLEDYYGPKNDNLSFPHFKGEGIIEESLACLRMIVRFFDMPFKKDLIVTILKDQIIRSKNKRISLPQFAAIFELLGFKVTPLTIKNSSLITRINFPAFVVYDGAPHIIWTKKRNKYLISDPKSDQRWFTSEKIFETAKHQLDFLLIEKALQNKNSKFDLSWFLPALRKNKGILFQVVLASFFVQLLALFNPLLIQQIFDAVISQGNLSSLNVLGTILISMSLAQALLGALRTFLFADMTNQIDTNLGSSIIHHLLRLPIVYFSKRSVGELNGRINELEKIRRFLTSTAITVFLDAIFSLIYIGVMMLYSVKLTFMALTILPLFIILTIIVAPINKKQLRKQAESKAKVQSHLVEALNGIDTIKGQGMEIYSHWRWEQLYSRQIKNGFRNIITNTAASSVSQFLSQLSGLIVIWGGAVLVLNGEMTLGQLIAFRILSGYVTSPILRLTSTWQNFQDIALSVERLGDVIDNKKESELNGDNLPPLENIEGDISFENVSLKFENSHDYQLKDINFKVKKGEFIAVIGSSGSGKSTLMKVLMRLYTPNQGLVKIDKNDINKFDLYSLRNQIGFVPQETLLFSGTIQSNISLPKPEASFEEIREAARVANADDFIQELSKGYSNDIGEKGVKISGGQKQRLSIARMIIKEPKIVILDEATSSLDGENERKVLLNIMKKFESQTVFFVTHKLDNMEMFTKILLMDKGKLIETGNHENLMKKNGKYAALIKKNYK